MNEARNWILYLTFVNALFQIRNVIHPRTDVHFYVSIAYLAFCPVIFVFSTRKNTVFMHISFLYMIVALPLRLLGFENTRSSLTDQQWIVRLLILALASFWNLIEYSRFLPTKIVSVIVMLLCVIYTTLCIIVGI